MSRKPYIPERGDIIHMDFTPSAGNELGGKHYGLVLSPAAYQRATGMAIVIGCTSKNYGDKVQRPLPTGLRLPQPQGYVRLHQVRSVDYQERKARFVDRVPAAFVDEIATIIAKFIGL